MKIISIRAATRLFIPVFLMQAAACSPFSLKPKPGPDKQFEGTFVGAASGAGTGAIIGAQVTAPTGPAAFIGAGFGAIFGGLSGLGIDLLEEDQLKRQAELRRLQELAWVHEVLAEHYSRRMELHPNRDIYPADWFFEGDSVKLRVEGRSLVKEIARITKERMPWSRIVVAVYSTSADSDSTYAKYLTKSRSNELAVELVRGGIEPRRVLTQGITMSEPILIDPDDNHDRYRQAVEIIALDSLNFAAYRVFFLVSHLVLILDDRGRLGPLVDEALSGAAVEVRTVTNSQEAKTVLLTEEPSVFLCNVTLEGDDKAGFSLCQQLRAHERFSELPVILVGDALDEDVIRGANESGVQGIVCWPIDCDILRSSLLPYLGGELPVASEQPVEILSTEPVVEGHYVDEDDSLDDFDHEIEIEIDEEDEDEEEEEVVAGGQSGAPISPEEAFGEEVVTIEAKLKKAQHLLAMVLHNLKTSNLLDVVDLEDVPGIVLQMARNVCGEAKEEPQPEVSPGTSESKGADVSLDLDSVFGLKK